MKAFTHFVVFVSAISYGFPDCSDSNGIIFSTRASLPWSGQFLRASIVSFCRIVYTIHRMLEGLKGEAEFFGLENLIELNPAACKFAKAMCLDSNISEGQNVMNIATRGSCSPLLLIDKNNLPSHKDLVNLFNPTFPYEFHVPFPKARKSIRSIRQKPFLLWAKQCSRKSPAHNYEHNSMNAVRVVSTPPPPRASSPSFHIGSPLAHNKSK
ncbi:hypothetical protein M427DRAFT_339382 [Gonapodya prolifera JEL478]|uniref:Uncharacterized protein n=1 Tax=Gonapodya prolifera (strain JEL478) TaxID=1344416 RepID=A0A139ADR9_GONPJ|nr:hypothetical protein M427DRAFT_339382 [Gonapodya prolifera JEL478]|eukprot:KXS14585.1 hypothetical protein M427DRAFT_339382 [Gonapodya prolifera JEL478]